MLHSKTILKPQHRVTRMAKRVKLYKDGQTMEVWQENVEKLTARGWSETEPKAKAKTTSKTEVATNTDEV